MPAYLNGGATRLQILIVLIVAVVAITLAVLAINYQRGLATAHTNASHSEYSPAPTQ